MKVQIIQLDAHDDFISTRDKMGWVQTGRIVLVWPLRGRILTRKLDLILLQRHSKALGVIFALVSTDSEVIHHANQLGIPIFNNSRDALDSPWRGKRHRLIRIQRDHLPNNITDVIRERTHPPSEKSITTSWIRIIAFGLSIIALLALISIFVPKAQLTLKPNRKIQEIQMLVSASPSFTQVSITGEIPSRALSTIVEGKKEIITNGSVQIPDKYAIGGVRFTTFTDRDTEIPIGTIVSTFGGDPIRFETTKAGNIKGGIGESVILPIKALMPGKIGNVPAQSIQAIEGKLGLTLSVVNPMPTHSGSLTAVPAPSTKDVSTLYSNLLAKLEDSALSELKSRLDPGNLIIDDTLSLEDILQESYDPPRDQPSNQIELTLQAEFEVTYLDKKDLQTLAKLVLDANLPKDYLPISDTIDIQPVSQPTIDKDGVIQWQIKLQREIIANIETIHVINMTLGLPVSQANMLLENKLELMDTPIISMSPTWWPRIPMLPFRVHIYSGEQS